MVDERIISHIKVKNNNEEIVGKQEE